jgi:L-lactate utilization protein LutB
MSFYIIEPSWNKKQKRYADILRAKLGVEPDIKEIKSKLLNIRRHSAAHIDFLVDLLKKNTTNCFKNVILAEDSEEATEFISKIANDSDNILVNHSSTVKRVVKPLESKGFQIIDTYENEYDTSQCRPLQNAIDLAPGLLWQSFDVKTFCPPASQCINDGIGVVGVNALSADGSTFFLQHFNNIRSLLSQTRRIILVAGLEKIVEQTKDAEFQAKCMGFFGFESILRQSEISRIQTRSKVNRPLNIKGTNREREVYLILLDDGRKRILDTAFADLFQCINCRACAGSCPTYQHYGNNLLSTPKQYLSDFLLGKSPHAEYCILCGKCSLVCPLIDVQKLMYDARSEKAISLPRAAKKRKVIVVGGGVAGMEASIVTARRGHEVMLYEKESRLGGQLVLAAAAPGKEKLLLLLEYLLNQLKLLEVTIHLGYEVHPDMVGDVNPDSVVIATGARPLVPKIPGIDRAEVLTAWDVLGKKSELSEREVAVLGGGMVGCETADFLAMQGNNVTIIEMMSGIAQDMNPLDRRDTIRKLREYRVNILTNQRVTEIFKKKVAMVNTLNGETNLIDAEQVVLALGARPIRDLGMALEGKLSELYWIGDCKQPRTLVESIYEGLLVGQTI